MRIIKSYKSGWEASLNSKALISYVYLIQLILALLLAIPFYKLFQSMAGYSLLPESLVSSFDATAMGELLRSGGKSLLFYIKGFTPWIILFVLLGVFFQGGIISWISNYRGRFSVSRFFGNCWTWFWPFFKTFIYSLLIQILIGVLVYLPVIMLVNRENLTDFYIGRTVIIGAAIHLVLLVWVTMVAEFTRLMLYRNSSGKVIKTLWKAIKFSIRRIFSLYGIYIIWMIIPAVLIVMYYFLRVNWGVDTALMVILLFIVQQVFVWLRIGLRIQKTGMFYGYLVINSIKG
jgi:hypothetical protein